MEQQHRYLHYRQARQIDVSISQVKKIPPQQQKSIQEAKIFYLNRYLKNKEKPFEKQVVASQYLDLNNTQMEAYQRQTRSTENMFPKDQ